MNAASRARSVGVLTSLVLVLASGCRDVRELTLRSALPSPCAIPAVNELRVRGLGDFPPGAAESLSLGVGGSMPSSAQLALPRATRVVSIEGIGPGGLVAFGRTAPTDLPTAWEEGGAARVISVAYGAPNSFCATARLAYARAEHRATLLSDGSVLMSGGFDSGGFPVVALERYLPYGDADAPVARFSPMGAGATLDASAVLGHDVTLLADGRALLSGGAPVVNDTITGTASADGIAYQGASVLSTGGTLDGAARVLPGGPRAFHAGLRLADGRILLTGGCSELTKGLCAAGRLQASVAVYDPKRDAFTSGLPLLVARAWHRAILRDDGLVLIVGGLGDAGQALPPELYDPDEARGTTLVGPAGSSVVTPGGMVTTLNDGGSAGDRVLGWSGRDEAPVAITQLASPRSDVTLTALEDGAVLFAGGREGQNLASTSVIVGPSGESELVAGFAAQGHTATRLHDGTVLLAGGIDATRRAGATSVVFLRSLTGPFDTPSTLTFDGPLALSPSRPGSVRVEGGALTVGAGSKPPRAVESYAVVPGPELAGPSAAGFSLSFLAGVEGDAEAAVIFGDPAASRYVAVVFAAGSSPRLLSVTPDRPGLPVVQEAVGCEAAPVDPAELPIVGTAPLTVTMRQGRIALTSAARTLLACGGQAAPPRGAIALGARTRSSGGVARFDNVQLGR